MIKKAKKWLSYPGALLLAALMIQGCTNPIESDTTAVQPVMQESAAPATQNGLKVNLSFVNALQNTGTEPYKTTISVDDPDGFLVTAGGTPAATVVTDNGVISLAIQDGASYPYSFTITASSLGFITQSRNILVTNKKHLAVQIRMLEDNTTAPGVGLLSANNIAINRGQATNNIVVSTNGNTSERMTIRIPAGTRFLDANQNPLPGGSLRIQARSYATSSTIAMDAMPAPLVTTNVQGQDGQPIADAGNPAIFRSLGMATVDMWVDGIEVKWFSNPIDFTFELDEQGTTGLQGVPLRDGMSVAVWSWNENNMSWVEEGQSFAFRRNEKGRLEATAKIIHLSTWNLDYKGNRCTSPLNFTINAPAGSYTLELRSAANGQPVSNYAQRTITVGSSGSEPMTLYNTPSDLGPLILVIRDTNGNVLEARTFAPCGTVGDFNLNGINCFNPTQVTVVCSDGASPAGIAIGYTGAPGSGVNILGITDNNGQFTACGIITGDPINLRAFVSSPLTLANYQWGGNGSNANMSVTANANGDLTITLPCN